MKLRFINKLKIGMKKSFGNDAMCFCENLDVCIVIQSLADLPNP